MDSFPHLDRYRVTVAGRALTVTLDKLLSNLLAGYLGASLAPHEAVRDWVQRTLNHPERAAWIAGLSPAVQSAIVRGLIPVELMRRYVAEG